MKDMLRRILGARPRTHRAADLDELQRRCAALEHALDEQRDVTRAILYAMGHAPNTYRERARRDLAIALAKGRESVPLSLLEPFEAGADAWHAEMAASSGRR